MSTKLLKESLSIKMGTVTANLKEALVCPLLKKSNLELIYKNCRLVLNLSYLIKLTEKTVSSHLTSYTNTTGITESLQSAYKWGILPKLHSLK